MVLNKRNRIVRMTNKYGGGNKKTGITSCIGKHYNLINHIHKRTSTNTIIENNNLQIYTLPKFSNELKNQLNNNQLNLLNYFENFDYNNNTIFKLYQQNFNNGTLRIRKPGIYILKENITFNPNEDYDHMPTLEQHNSGLYPSMGNLPYKLGFFSAITIECDNVILDLNGYTLEQSKQHFLQQRFYANIELASAPFIGPQGPGVPLGENNYVSGNNVLIMNGTLGLSSHHGIHSNFNKNIVLHNLEINNFQVAGISLNGLENSVFNNININNSISPVPVLFPYSQARFIRKALQRIPNNYSINIQGIEKTRNEILNNINDELNITYNEFINNQPISSKLFKNTNKNQISDGNIYGIVLNITGVVVNDFLQSRPENVFITNLQTRNKDIFLYNIKINNISSMPHEAICIDISGNPGLEGYSKNNNFVRGPFGDIFDANIVSSSYLSGNYVSNSLSDAQAILGKYNLENNDNMIGTAYTSNDILNWIENPQLDLNNVVQNDNPDLLSFVFGKDAMAHTLKGNIGLFISGGKNIKGNNIDIDNIQLYGTNSISNNNEQGKYVYGVLNTASVDISFNNIQINNIYSEYGNNFSKKYFEINL